MSSSTSSSDADNDVGRYGAMAAVTLALLLATVAAINFAVDPYRLFRAVDVAGFNAVKPRAFQQVELSKARGIAAIKPSNLILGNSRAAVGFDPFHPRWPAPGPTYNAAVPGKDMATALRMLQQAVAAGDVRRVLLGVDFVDFLVDPQADPRSMVEVNFSQWGRMLSATLFSMDALFDSIITIATQSRAELADITANGFTPMRDYEEIVRREGYGPMFAQRIQENARAYARKPRGLFLQGTGSSPRWDQIEQIMALCRSEGARLDFIIYPYHAQLLELIRLNGLWPQFETWKRELSRRVAANSGARVTSSARLWDFSGYHAFALEHAPTVDERTFATQWYWEAGHFKKSLGDRVLESVLSDAVSDGFGAQIDESNIDGHLQVLRASQARYESDNTREVDVVRQVVDAARQAVHSN